MTPLLAGQMVVAATFAAMILMIGVSWLYHARLRVARYGLLPMAALILLALGTGAFSGSLVRKTDASSTGIQFHDVLIAAALFPTELLRLLKGLRNLSKQPMHEVEHALPRAWTRRWRFSGILVGTLGVVCIAACIYLAATTAGSRMWLFGAAMSMFVVWGILAFCAGGRVEFGRDYLRLGSRLFPWAALGNFEWYTDTDGTHLSPVSALPCNRQL